MNEQHLFRLLYIISHSLPEREAFCNLLSTRTSDWSLQIVAFNFDKPKTSVHENSATKTLQCVDYNFIIFFLLSNSKQ